MSQIRETVKFSVAVPYTSQNQYVQLFIDHAENGHIPFVFGNWYFTATESPVKSHSKLFGWEITSGRRKVRFVICDGRGDDYVYFVANTRKTLDRFVVDNHIVEPILAGQELWTVR